MKLLVAEDDPDIANLHKIILETRGHRVVLAHDGQKCLENYHNMEPSEPLDAVVLDYRMPLLDGIEVAREILQLNKDQRIIIATARVKDTLNDSIKELGQLVEIIEKPFEPELLVSTVEDTLKSSKLNELDAIAKTTYDDKNLSSQTDKLLNRLKAIQQGYTL